MFLLTRSAAGLSGNSEILFFKCEAFISCELKKNSFCECEVTMGLIDILAHFEAWNRHFRAIVNEILSFN